VTLQFVAAALLFFWADPSSFEAVFRSGLVALGENRLEVAQKDLETAARLKPADPEVWLALAQTYRKRNQVAAATSAISRAESLAGNNLTALNGLILYFSQSGEYQKAASFASRVVQKQDRADLRVIMGEADEAEHRPKEAAEQFEHAIRLNPYEEDYYFRAARAYALAGDPPSTIKVVAAGKKIFANSEQLELMLGIAYYALQRYTEAADTFLSAIRMDSSVPQPYVFLGRMMDHAPSRLPQILAAFKALADKAPDDYLGNFLYGKALLQSGGDEDRAGELLRKSVSLKADYWESHLELARALELKGRFDDAARELRRAIELNPKSATAHFRLGRVLDRLGQPDAAKAEYAIQSKLIDDEESRFDPLRRP